MHTGKHPGNKRIEGKEGEGIRGGRTPRGNSSTGGLGVGGDDSVCECVCNRKSLCVRQLHKEVVWRARNVTHPDYNRPPL